MAVKESWVFDGYCSQKSKLGVLLYSEIMKIKKENQLIDKEDLRRIALINLGETIGCEIKPNDFLGLGAREYLDNKKEVLEGIRKKIDAVMIKPRRC